MFYPVRRAFRQPSPDKTSKPFGTVTAVPTAPPDALQQHLEVRV